MLLFYFFNERKCVVIVPVTAPVLEVADTTFPSVICSKMILDFMKNAAEIYFLFNFYCSFERQFAECIWVYS